MPPYAGGLLTGDSMGLGDGFYRIKRLPPYVFAQVQSLKLEARQQGEDIIDFGMGNPDQPTPSHIVEKMIEAARKGKNHRDRKSVV